MVATINYKIKENHPDKNCVVGGWEKEKVYSYTDNYYNATEDDVDFIINDLKLVAGGGYRTNTIEVVSFMFDGKELTTC